MTWLAFLSLGIALSIAAAGCWLLDRIGHSSGQGGSDGDGPNSMTAVAISLAAVDVSNDTCGESGASAASSDT